VLQLNDEEDEESDEEDEETDEEDEDMDEDCCWGDEGEGEGDQVDGGGGAKRFQEHEDVTGFRYSFVLLLTPTTAELS
jgi:hypothetical protein